MSAAKKYDLDTIEKVDLRDVWPHEALDFTKWMAEEKSLKMLSDAVGVELELLETESSVGSFNVDIYAQESGTGRKVIIENQLEETNHDHLGKVITYAAGKSAEVVIWVVKRARDEHRQAIEWLNQHTDSEFGFFQVGDVAARRSRAREETKGADSPAGRTPGAPSRPSIAARPSLFISWLPSC